jgi:hypothetical protein
MHRALNGSSSLLFNPLCNTPEPNTPAKQQSHIYKLTMLESDNEKTWNPMQQYAMKLTRASVFFADLLATDLQQLCVFWILDVKKSAPSSRV